MADEIRGPLAQILLELTLLDSKACPEGPRTAGGEAVPANPQDQVADYLERVVRASARRRGPAGGPFVVLPEA